MDEPEPVPVVGPACPWCSAALDSTDQPTCPACGANLAGDPEVEIEGVTALDREARMRLGLTQQAGSSPKRSLLSWMATEKEPELTLDPETAAILGEASSEPPSAAVRREMLRLEMEDLQRELERAAAEAAAPPLILVDPTGESLENLAEIVDGADDDALDAAAHPPPDVEAQPATDAETDPAADSTTA